MELKDSDRVGTRLLAVNIRLYELEEEMRRTQARVHQLESQLEDARLARMVGEDAGNPDEIDPELQSSRDALQAVTEIVERVRKSQWKLRVEHTLLRVKERRAERASEQPE